MLPSNSQQVCSIVAVAGAENIHLSVLVVLEVHFGNNNCLDAKGCIVNKFLTQRKHLNLVI